MLNTSKKLFKLVVIAAVVLLFTTHATAAAVYDCFSGVTVPAGDVGTLYDAFFLNMNTMLPCTLTGEITVAGNISMTRTIPIGCIPPSQGNYLSWLRLLPIGQISTLDKICTSEEPLSSNLQEATLRQFFSLQPLDLDGVAGVTVVLSQQQSTQGSSSGGRFNISCLASLITQWNSLGLSPPISGLMMPASTADLSHCSPLSSGSDEWTSGLQSTLWSSFNFSMTLFQDNTSTASQQQYAALVKRASFNTFAQDNNIATLTAVDVVQPMSMSLLGGDQNCLYTKTCLPLGGMNVIGTTASLQWNTSNTSASAASYVKSTPPASIAILIRASSLALFHDAIPAADASASGIVAALLVMDEISKWDLPSNGPQVYSFFFTADEYNRTGSSRMIYEMNHFVCERFPKNVPRHHDCDFPYYVGLNFTTVDLSEFDHFIEIQLVGSSSSPLFLHVDQNYNASAPSVQYNVNSLFLGANASDVKMASSRTFPPSSSLRSFIDHFLQVENVSVTRATRSFSLLSRFDSTLQSSFPSTLFTPQDVASTVSMNSVVEAANQVLRVLQVLLSNPQGSSPSVTNVQLASDLWSCFTEDFSCSLLSATSGVTTAEMAPNYYTSVFQYNTYIQPFQRLISAQLQSSKLNVSYSHSFSVSADYVDSPLIQFSLSAVDGSIFVESNWDKIGLRLFMLPSEHVDVGLIIVGVVLTVVTAVAVKMVCLAS